MAELREFRMPELSPGGGDKREGNNDREPKLALYIITKENQTKNNILYLAGVTFGGQGRVKVCQEGGAFGSAG